MGTEPTTKVGLIPENVENVQPSPSAGFKKEVPFQFELILSFSRRSNVDYPFTNEEQKKVRSWHN